MNSFPTTFSVHVNNISEFYIIFMSLNWTKYLTFGGQNMCKTKKPCKEAMEKRSSNTAENMGNCLYITHIFIMLCYCYLMKKQSKHGNVTFRYLYTPVLNKVVLTQW